MTATLSICFAIFGISSQIWMPGTLVAMGRNGPPVGRPGFMSNVSNWLAPPFIHSRMQCLLLLADLRGQRRRAGQPAPVHHHAARGGGQSALHEWRRERWSDEWENERMTDSEVTAKTCRLPLIPLEDREERTLSNFVAAGEFRRSNLPPADRQGIALNLVDSQPLLVFIAPFQRQVDV